MQFQEYNNAYGSKSIKQKLPLIVFLRKIMDEYERSRRDFLRKLGLTFGATITTSAMLSANISEPAEKISITPEQKEFMDMYENWMDGFIEVIRINKQDPDNYENKINLVALTERSKQWQEKLNQYMRDEDFARYYMIKTERMTLEI